MPGMDGMSVLKAIKQSWPKSEVVVITGYPTVESAKEAVRLGAYDYLAKPVGPAEVINAANGAITQKKWALRKDASEPRRNNRSPCRGRAASPPDPIASKGESHERNAESAGGGR